MTDPVIAGVGTYLPRDRLSSDAVRDAWGMWKARGIETVAVAGPDEDSLTMGIAAARRALDASGVRPTDVEGVWFATTTPPLAEESLTPRLGAALNLPADAVRHAERGDTRAGTGAVVSALDASARPAVVVASDVPRGEPTTPEGHAAGAGATAVVVHTAGKTDAGARVHARATHASPYPGSRFRQPGETTTEGFGVREYDRAAFRTPAVKAVQQLDAVEPHSDADALAITTPDGDRPKRVARALGMQPAQLATPVASVGDTGVAAPLLGLARGGDRTLVVGVGSGAVADALFVAGRPPVVGHDRPTRSVSYTTALRRRETITGDPPNGGGARVSIPTWRRTHAARYRLTAGRCPACEAVSFPGSGACRSCHELVEYEPVQLPRRGTVVASAGVSPAGAPPEFVPQTKRGGGYPVAIVRFGRDDWRVDVPLQIADQSDVAAGESVRVVVRLIDRLDGLPRYGAKARPA